MGRGFEEHHGCAPSPGKTADRFLMLRARSCLDMETWGALAESCVEDL